MSELKEHEKPRPGDPTQAEWHAQGKAIFGDNFMKWRSKCPSCGNVASIQEYQGICYLRRQARPCVRICGACAMSFKCPGCHRVSHNPNDAKHQYCVACNRYWDDGAALEEQLKQELALKHVRVSLLLDGKEIVSNDPVEKQSEGES